MSVFKNLRLAVRLGIGFGTLAVALLVVGLLSISRIGGLDGDIKTLAHRDATALDLVGQMSSRAATMNTDTTQHLYVFDGDLKSEDALAAEVTKFDDENDRDGKTLTALTKGTAAADDVARFEDAHEKFVADAKTVIARSRKETLAKKDNRDGSRNYYSSTVRPDAAAVAAAAATLQTEVSKVADESATQATANARSAKTIILIVALLALAAAVALARSSRARSPARCPRSASACARSTSTASPCSRRPSRPPRRAI
jgi:methyl-accepting chemotaxis protein